MTFFLQCLLAGGYKEYHVLRESYYKLVQVLPVDSLSHRLVTAKIIDFNDEEEIASRATSKQKATYVFCKIAGSLEAGYTEKFYQLLTIMEEYGGDVAKLADEIRTSLNGILGMKSVSCTVYMVSVVLYEVVYVVLIRGGQYT